MQFFGQNESNMIRFRYDERAVFSGSEPPMTSSPNQREFTRVPVSVSTTLRAGQIIIQSLVTKDLSMSGIYVQTHDHLSVGTECEIKLLLGDGEIEIQAQGQVVRTDSNGLAIQFVKIMGLESYQHLQNLVRYNAPDPGKVEDEFQEHAGIRHKT